MELDLETFAQEGQRRFRDSPAGKWRLDADSGTLIFYDMCLILRRDGTGSYEGYTKKPDGSGQFNIWEGRFRWEPLEPFCIRLQLENHSEWCVLQYTIGARRRLYNRVGWVIDWKVVSGDSANELVAFGEQLDAGWGDLKDDEY